MRGFPGRALLACGLVSIAYGGEALPVPTAGGLKIYANQMDPADFTDLRYGYDRNAVCANGTTACSTDFKVCDDGLTICSTNANCAGIGTGVCHANPCGASPNNVCGVLVQSLTPGAPAGQTIAQLACGPSVLPCTVTSWDFSQINKTQFSGLIDTASTQTAINLQETPNANQCGFTEPGAALGREDVNFPDPPHTIKTLNALDRENGILSCTKSGQICTSNADCTGTDPGTCGPNVSIWLRGVVRWEGISGGFGFGQSRLCFSGPGRTAVPLWRFPNQDAQGFYMQLGDPRWKHTPFGCEQDITVGTGNYWIQSCNGFEGTQSGEVINEGVVKLPSGHQFRSLVVRSLAEYCVYFGPGCGLQLDNVRTVLHMWQVPHLGTVVRLQSDKTATNKTDFTHLAEIDVKYGLFPPLSLQAGQVTGTSVALSWNPGAITDNIDGYRIYWDTESGGRCAIGGEDCTADHPGAGDCAARETCCAAVGDTCQSYGFDSINDAGQVTFTGTTSATVSGLTPGTTYYFTVTAMSDFKDPSTLVTRTYESVKYPTRIPAVPVDLPIEVSATTSCAVPSVEVTGVTGAKAGSNLQLCWNPVTDPCASSYQILGASSPTAAANFSVVVPDTGPATCSVFNPTNKVHFIVVGKGSGGTGPWGHFGQ